MTTDAASPQRAAAKEDQPADDFIGLGGDDDFIKFDEASDAGEDTSDAQSTDQGSTFHPHRIDLTTFRKLLACYPTTVEQVHRRKMMLKLQPKPEKGSKRKTEKKAGSAPSNMRGAALIQKTDFSASEEKYIRDETAKFLKLDCWRYEAMPDIIAGRKSTSENAEGVFLTKEELINVMDWKTKHGLPRPTLMGMVKSNQQKNVSKCTSAALAALPSKDPVDAPYEAFPKASIDALNPLRGVGPATASLILSIATVSDNLGNQVPFYSDDLYLWLCLKDFPEPAPEPEHLISGAGAESSKPKKKVSKYKRPNGELNIKYNIAEYRQLWHASWELRQRLNKAVDEEEKELPRSKTSGSISHIDIEKVAYVLRHIAVSGFFPDVDPTEILKVHAEQEARGIAHDQAQRAAKAISQGLDKAEEKKKAEKKRKRQEEKSEKEVSSRNNKKKT